MSDIWRPRTPENRKHDGRIWQQIDGVHFFYWMQNSNRHFADGILESMLLNERVCILNRISLNCVLDCLIDILNREFFLRVVYYMETRPTLLALCKGESTGHQ